MARVGSDYFRQHFPTFAPSAEHEERCYRAGYLEGAEAALRAVFNALWPALAVDARTSAYRQAAAFVARLEAWAEVPRPREEGAPTWPDPPPAG